MKKRMKATVILASALLLAALWGGAALAAGGDQSDPLVTLSYLNTSAIPQIIAKVEESAANRQAELAKLFDGQVAQYRKDAAVSGAAGSSGPASYALVTLNKGQALTPEVGCELLLRVGAMTVSAPEAPALIDLSSGGTLNSGASLEKNHLYMATIAGRTVQATAETVKVLVRGSYAVA